MRNTKKGDSLLTRLLQSGLFQPIIAAIAFNQTILSVRSVVSPIHNKQIKMVSRLGKCLPRDCRGAFVSLVQDKVHSGMSLSAAAGEAIADILEYEIFISKESDND